jgi:hypothetical protein
MKCCGPQIISQATQHIYKGMRPLTLTLSMDNSQHAYHLDIPRYGCGYVQLGRAKYRLFTNVEPDTLG